MVCERCLARDSPGEPPAERCGVDRLSWANHTPPSTWHPRAGCRCDSFYFANRRAGRDCRTNRNYHSGQFRSRDIAAGGQGAPLAPVAHALLLKHARQARLVVNLGGISNVTYVPKGGHFGEIQAFDTGPANMVLDSLMVRVTDGRLLMDRDGKLAMKGQVDSRLLGKLLAHPFLSKRPPKSTGREAFGPDVIEELIAIQQQRRLSIEDLLATCSMWTAKAVGTSRRWIDGEIDEVVVGGGGVRNRAIMSHLATVFAPVPVTTFEALGWDSK